ncbi:MAG TPA: TIGR04283 family arsenosugar biosynthesis glycosyltransferase [Chthoniobacterales bacterium]
MNDPVAGALRLSVIVPAWNEAGRLAQLIPSLVRLGSLHQIIVVDASDNNLPTEEWVRSAGATYLRAPTPSRGAQMNLGAAHATGDALIFHHADAILRTEHLEALARALHDPAIIGGAFYRKFDRRHPRLVGLESLGRFLSGNGGTLFGDQSLFVRREVFDSLGGFADIPLMEDMEFSRRLRRAGKVAVLDPPMESSGRRHQHRGAWRTSLQNAFFILLYYCGCSPHRLHRWYYGSRFSAPNESALAAQPVEEFRGS